MTFPGGELLGLLDVGGFSPAGGICRHLVVLIWAKGAGKVRFFSEQPVFFGNMVVAVVIASLKMI